MRVILNNNCLNLSGRTVMVASSCEGKKLPTTSVRTCTREYRYTCGQINIFYSILFSAEDPKRSAFWNLTQFGSGSKPFFNCYRYNINFDYWKIFSFLKMYFLKNNFSISIVVRFRIQTVSLLYKYQIPIWSQKKDRMLSLHKPSRKKGLKARYRPALVKMSRPTNSSNWNSIPWHCSDSECSYKTLGLTDIHSDMLHTYSHGPTTVLWELEKAVLIQSANVYII